MIEFPKPLALICPPGWSWANPADPMHRELHRQVRHVASGTMVTDAVIAAVGAASFPMHVWEARVLSAVDVYIRASGSLRFPTYTKVLTPATDYMLLVDAVELLYPSRMGEPVI